MQELTVPFPAPIKKEETLPILKGILMLQERKDRDGWPPGWPHREHITGRSWALDLGVLRPAWVLESST